MSSKKTPTVHRVWLKAEMELILQWMAANKTRVKQQKVPQLCQEMKSQIEEFRENDNFPVTRIFDKFHNMKKQYGITKGKLNSTSHGVEQR